LITLPDIGLDITEVELESPEIFFAPQADVKIL
jgi:hypothetical protein